MARLINPNEPVFYEGSKLLEPLTSALSLPLDQLNFIVSQTLALCLAFIFRRVFHYDRFSIETRHWLNLIPGLLIGFFCFGFQITNVFILITLGYVGIVTCPPSVVHRAILVLALLYLSYVHLMRQILDYGGYVVDISGPMMIAVQKITSIAFNIYDGGARDDEELTPEQRRYAVRRRPSMLEFYSYMFSFGSLLCGPLVWFNDYEDFISGENFKRHHKNRDDHKSDPSPFLSVAKKLFTAFSFSFLLLYLAPRFPIDFLKEYDFSQKGIFYKVYFILIVTMIARFKYYFAWLFGEAICNMAGLGFNGYSLETERPKWDLVSTVDIARFELSMNFREALQAWNIPTQTWLRRCAYERARRFRTLATYLLSAVWHGFYPGYYYTFLTGALFTQAARSVRRSLRWRFHESSFLRFIYHVATFITTRLFMAYAVFPFVLLEFHATYNIYKQFYFSGHLLALVAHQALPLLLPAPKQAGTTLVNETLSPIDKSNHTSHLNNKGSKHTNNAANGKTAQLQNGKKA